MPGELTTPAKPQVAPGFPDSLRIFAFESFEGLNTKALRPGIKDEEMAWSDGWMPLGSNNLRCLWGCGPSIFTGNNIQFFGFGNIGATPLAIILQGDGSLIQVNTNSLVSLQIAPAGTILNPGLRIGLSQWGSQYILFVAPQTNGYFIWDGSSLYQSGSLGPITTITAAGTGYTANFPVTFTGGSGVGATGIATVANGGVVSVQVTNPGSGYVVGDTVTIDFSAGSGSSATGTGMIMPFGVQGTTIETYQSRVWIGNGPKLIFSAPGSPVDFLTSDGAGVAQSTDSFLRRAFIEFKQTNGFLYTIADSSINYISGVSTSGSGPAVTTFSNLNVDPQIGAPWAQSVQVFSRNIVLANSFGVHVSYGGAVTKISQPLDGIYNTAGPDFGGFNPSSAVAGIFGIVVYMLLLPVVDSFTGVLVNKLLMWDGKRWWTSQQDRNLTFIAAQEIDSVLTAWGTDGTNLFQLFEDSTVTYQKVLQSKLYSNPSYLYTKTGLRVYGIMSHANTTPGALVVYIDNETQTPSAPVSVNPNSATWYNNSSNVVHWTNNSAVIVIWAGGLTVFGPITVAQDGRLLGLTIVTQASDISLISAMVLGQDYSANV